MTHDWIIGVLDDLHGFADANGLPVLASQLEEALIVAAAELGQDASAAELAGMDDAEVARPA
jgi:hypothetical protein